MEALITCKYLYLDKWDVYIETLHRFMCIHVVPITWSKLLVTFIPWNFMLHHRYFQWSFSSLSVRSSCQMDEIELRTLVLPAYTGFQLNMWWYFEGELRGCSDMSKYFLINDEQYYWEIKIGGGVLSITNVYEPKSNSSI